jgi:protein TonB
MSSYQLQADPKRQALGLACVIVVHLLVAYVLVSGLAKHVVEVVRSPVQTQVIEEVKKAPPPPEVVIPPPRLEAPPPPFVPPPEVTITQPPPAPTIVAVTPTPPPAPVVIAPVPAPVVAVAPPAPPRPAVVSLRAACSRIVPPQMPERAERAGISGSVKARLTIKGGRVIHVEILDSTPRGVFDDAVRKAVLQYGCQDNGDREVVAVQPFEFVAPS